MKQEKSNAIWRRIILIVLAVVLVIAVPVMAYYLKNSGEVSNNFHPADSITPTVAERFKNNVKEDVCVEVGVTEYPVYVRAKILITWKDKKTGNVIYEEPIAPKPILDGDKIIGYEGDYLIDLNLSNNGWVLESDGYYYYTTPVESGKKTDVLIKSLVPNVDTGDRYLSAEIITQTVQAVGFTDEDNTNGVIPAYRDAWGLSKNFG